MLSDLLPLLVAITIAPTYRCDLQGMVKKAVNAQSADGGFDDIKKSCRLSQCPSTWRPGAPCQCVSSCRFIGVCCFDYRACGRRSFFLNATSSQSDTHANESAAESSMHSEQLTLNAEVKSAGVPAAAVTPNDTPAGAVNGTVQSKALFNDLDSCEEMKCPEAFRPGASCQCERSCTSQGNCCWDYGKCGNVAFGSSAKRARNSSATALNVSGLGKQKNSAELIYP